MPADKEGPQIVKIGTFYKGAESLGWLWVNPQRMRLRKSPTPFSS